MKTPFWRSSRPGQPRLQSGYGECAIGRSCASPRKSSCTRRMQLEAARDTAIATQWEHHNWSFGFIARRLGNRWVRSLLGTVHIGVIEMIASNSLRKHSLHLILSAFLSLVPLKVLPAVISLEYPDLVRVGNVFDVTINISDARTSTALGFPLSNWQLRLGWPSSVQPYPPNSTSAFDPGDFGGIGQGGLLQTQYQSGTVPLYLEMSHYTNCGATCAESVNQLDDFRLVTVHFMATGATDAMAFVLYDSVVLEDSQGFAIPYTFDNGRQSRWANWTIVSNKTLAIIPAPSTLLLLAVALPALVARIRRSGGLKRSRRLECASEGCQ